MRKSLHFRAAARHGLFLLDWRGRSDMPLVSGRSLYLDRLTAANPWRGPRAAALYMHAPDWPHLHAADASACESAAGFGGLLPVRRRRCHSGNCHGTVSNGGGDFPSPV